MAKNYIQECDSIQLVAPVGGVVGGTMYKQGSFTGVVEHDALEGEQFTLNLEGAYDTLKKKAAEAWSKGDKLYFDVATGELSKDNTKEFSGYAYYDALAADVTGAILLKQ
jgi:predicted RecA/RadA family phage recombinase